jgi:hypothetical protein
MYRHLSDLENLLRADETRFDNRLSKSPEFWRFFASFGVPVETNGGVLAGYDRVNPVCRRSATAKQATLRRIVWV